MWFCRQYMVKEHTMYFTRTFKVQNISFYVLPDCDNGTYGKDCNNTCGHCFDKNSCFHSNGSCLNGCEPGFTGELCKSCMYVIIQQHVHVCMYEPVVKRLFVFCQTYS